MRLPDILRFLRRKSVLLLLPEAKLPCPHPTVDLVHDEGDNQHFSYFACFQCNSIWFGGGYLPTDVWSRRKEITEVRGNIGMGEVLFHPNLQEALLPEGSEYLLLGDSWKRRKP